MELQINDLVSAIKKEGIETAQKEADAIIQNAKQQAETILADAKDEADKLLSTARKNIEVFENNAKISADQAKRDAILAVRSELQNEITQLLNVKVAKTVDEELLSKLIMAAIKEEDPSLYAVEVRNVSDDLKAELASEISKGLEIRLSKNMKGGFKLISKDGSGYIDCSDEELTALLMPFFRDIRL